MHVALDKIVHFQNRRHMALDRDIDEVNGEDW